MKLDKRGPKIHPELLRAKEAGRLVLFCGAGTSMPNGLPSFKELVKQLSLRLLRGKPEFDEGGGLDSTLAEMERDHGADTLRKHVCQLLENPSRDDLAYQRALCDLATDALGRTHLVTTNFDTLLESSCPDLTRRLAIAPRLPVPRPHRWNSLVHLHGCIADDEDPGHRNLVLTSRDFGIAYLTERWASQFVTELFRNFTVLFIGYSAGDPIMRYLVDAIAAEREVDDRVSRAFAFAGHGERPLAEVESDWRRMGMFPLLYEDAGHHEALTKTVQQWAELARAGLTSRRNVVVQFAPLRPSSLSEEDVSQLLWAIGDVEGVGASHFALAETAATYEWIPVIHENGLLDTGAQQDRRWEPPLVGPWAVNALGAPVGPRTGAFLRWIAGGIGEAEVARWVAASGGVLHPQLADRVRVELANRRDLPQDLRRFWSALTDGLPIGRSQGEDVALLLPSLLEHSGWDQLALLKLVSALSPWVRIAATYFPSDLDQKFDGQLRIRSLASIEVRLAADQAAEFLLESLRNQKGWTQALSAIAEDIVGLLRKALALEAIFERASADRDGGSYEAIGSQASALARSGGWFLLVDLCLEAIASLRDVDAERRSALLTALEHIPYPTARRVCIHAVDPSAGRDATRLLTLMCADPETWIWSSSIIGDVVTKAPAIWAALEGDGRRTFESLICQGPGSVPYSDDSPTAQELERGESAMFELLASLEHAPVELSEDARDRLASIRRAHPNWRNARGAMPEHGVAIWGEPSDFSAAELARKSDSELTNLLLTYEDNRAGLLEAWGDVILEDMERGIRIIRGLDSSNDRSQSVVRAALEALQGRSLQGPVPDGALRVLKLIPEDSLTDQACLWPAAFLLRAIAQQGTSGNDSDVLELWDQMWPASAKVEAGRLTSDVLAEAINHPSGVLAEALLHRLGKATNSESGARLDVFQGRLEGMLSTPDAGGGPARVILASRLWLLHRIAPDWTARMLLPRFDWSDTLEAVRAWRGFLWSPRVDATLFGALKSSFLNSFDHLPLLGDGVEGLVYLFAAVAVESRGALTDLESAQCLRRLEDGGRANVAFWLQKRLEGAGEQAAHFWAEFVSKWLRASWPDEMRLKGEKTSFRLVLAILHSDAAYPDAVGDVLPRIGPLPGRELASAIQILGEVYLSEPLS